MSNAYFQDRHFYPVLGRDRSSCVELWHVNEISDWNPNNTVGQVFSKLPYGGNRGVVHPDQGLLGITLSYYRLQDLWVSSAVDGSGAHYMEAMVAVYFDSPAYGPGNAGRQGGFVREFTSTIDVPSWTNVGSAPAPIWKLTIKRRSRITRRRYFTRFVNTDNVTGPRVDSIGLYEGMVFALPFGNMPYIFVGANIDDVGGGFTRVTFCFESNSPVRAAIVRPLGQPNNFAVPSLGPLDEYIWSDGGVASPIPVVVDRWEDNYIVGEVLDIPFFQTF